MYITDDAGSRKYEIFAAYEVSTDGSTYQISFSGDESKQTFISYCLDKSVIETGITPTVHDRILTLSTCTGSGHATRWVVQAVLKGEAPATVKEGSIQERADESAPVKNGGDTGPAAETEGSGGETAPTYPAVQANARKRQ